MIRFFRGFFVLFCLFSQSCVFTKHPNSTGKPLEIILVKGEECSGRGFNVFKDSLVILQKPLFELEFYGEKKNLFHIISIKEADFSKIFRTHQNIVFVNCSDEFKTQKATSVWAKNQTVYFCSIGKNENKISELAMFVGKEIKKNEVTKRKKRYKKTTPKKIQSYLNKKHNLSVSVPSNFLIIDSLNKTLHLRGDTKKSSQRILITSFDLEPRIENIILEQNRIAKNNISSDIEESFICVEERASIHIDSLIKGDQKTVNIRGLWKMEGDFMGGVFFTSLVVNKKTYQNTLISLYLYAPGENKANYLLDFEAIQSSIKCLNN